MLQMINQFETYTTQDGYFNALNLGGFTSSLYVSYMLNEELFSFSSGIFTLFSSKEIKIPANATNIHLYALISNGLGQWTPVYNNNLLSTGIIELRLHGTIFSPYASIIRDSNPTHLKVLAKNNAGFVSRYNITYLFNGFAYTMESQSFSLGMSREIAIPSSATNISLTAEYYSGFNWIKFYDNTIPKASNIELTFTGTTTNPAYSENISTPPSGDNGIIKKQALVIAAKKPHKNVGDITDIITFVINISNPTSTVAKDVVLKETLPNELEFIPNSLKINGVNFQNISLSSSELNLGDIQIYSSILVTYQAKIISTPSNNQIMNPSNLTFSYLNENNELKTSSSIGSVISLFVGVDPSNPCSCNCNCQPNT